MYYSFRLNFSLCMLVKSKVTHVYMRETSSKIQRLLSLQS